MEYSEVLEAVPSYQGFLTVDELRVSSRALAGKYPDAVELLEIGKSSEGRKIEALKIGDGPLNALLFAFPHPNEPIGSLTLQFLSERLSTDKKLRRKLGYTWLIVKCIDPDGAKLNEGWFKGEFTPLKYALNFYRPPGKNQVEWTFPIDYKSLRWHTPLPETRALMTLIEKYKPRFMYSLHNAGFCGVYFYVSRECKALYPKFRELVKSQRLPLHLGEPETPHLEKLDDAIFKMFGVAQTYDHIEKYTDEDPAAVLEHGTSSDDYLKRVCDGFTLVCEMPYYYDKRIGDQTPSDINRRKAVLEGIRTSEETYGFLLPLYNRFRRDANHTSRLFKAVDDYMKRFPKRTKPMKKHAETAPEYEGKATVAQAFDSLTAGKFYQTLILGEALRVVKEAHADSKQPYLKEIQDKIYHKMIDLDRQIAQESQFEVIPIQRLVRVQLGSALLTAEYLKKTR